MLDKLPRMGEKLYERTIVELMEQGTIIKSKYDENSDDFIE